MRAVFLFLISLCLASCNNFEYNPNQVFDRNSLKDLNAANLKKLGNGAGDDTVRFVLTGDTQRTRDETIELYQKVNTMTGIDFLVVAGDISEFGVLKEMEWIANVLAKLNIPNIAVIGNHDMVARGRAVFTRMFGSTNFSFVYGGIKFVCHDTNSREYNFNGQIPDISWLKKELQSVPDVNNFVAISHVPPNNSDFDEKLVKDYTAAFAATPGFLASLHAHTHNYDEFYPDNSGIPYLITSAVIKKEFLLIQIVNNQMSYERVSF